MKFFKTIVLISAVFLAFGCSTLDKAYKATTSQSDQALKKNKSEASQMLATHSRVNNKETAIPEKKQAYVGLKRIDAGKYRQEKASKFLNQKITLKVNREISGHELLKALAREGVNITSSMPLDNFFYAGYGVTQMPVEAALKSLLGAMRLDYKIDYDNQIVVVTPMKWRTWYFNLGSRSTKYQSGDSSSSTSSSSSSSSSSTSSGSEEAVSATGFSDSGTSSIQSQDDFWKSLEKEIKARMTILVPSTSGGSSVMLSQPAAEAPTQTAATVNMAVPMTTGGGHGLYQEELIGRSSFNAETGAVSVQAPHWVLEDLDDYFKRVQLQYNTVITFEGRLYMVSTSAEHSKGIDLSGFTEFISGYNLYARNNVLGGITVSTTNAFDLSSGAQAVAKTLFGVGKQDQTFNLFSAYLEKMGDVTIVQKPIISTTSGVPGQFSKFDKQYYNTVTQEATAGDTGSAATATSNELVAVEFGTLLRINPRYDVEKDLVRAQITLNQKFLSGYQQTTQQITSGSTVTEVPVTIPLLTQSLYEGEAIMKDGEVIILGGQIERSSQSESQGVPLAKDLALVGDLFGSGTKESNLMTYYFALAVDVERR